MGIFLREAFFDVQTIVEQAAPDKPKSYYVQGIVMQAENENRNGRIYPRKVLEKEVARYKKEYVDKNRALGEFGHPDSPSIQMERISHVITNLEQSGNDFVGRGKVIGEGLGKIARTLIDEGVKLGASSRGVGSLQERAGKQYVSEDYVLTTAFDIVHDPSGINCWINGLTERREWVYESGVWTAKALDTSRKRVLTAPKADLERVMLEEFNRLLGTSW